MGRISMPQGKGSQLHNRRDYEKIGREVPGNIDKNLTRENITLVDQDIREAYQEIFGEALAQYNSKQKRADRRIENYYEHIAKSKNGEKLFYEDVLQWGKKEDFENPQTRERAKEALVRYANTFEQRNPNLRLIGAYIHMDEASPHLHLDYVPVAHGYSRGLSTRNSLDKAMKEMGFVPEKESRKNNATKLWKENERAYFGEICRSMGLEVEAERKARGSLSVEEYKEAREEMLGEIEQEYAEKKAQVESIITRAREWAESVKKQYQEVAGKVEELLGRKKLLENDIADLQNTQKALAPLRAEVTELKRAKDVLSGELDYELTKAKFKSWSSMPFGTSYDAYRKRGELLALYKDGTIRQVGSNEHGGFDNKTLADEKKGLCVVGIMQDEERVRVPKSVLKELMQARDREKPISKSLQNFITQQTEVAKVVHDRGRSR